MGWEIVGLLLGSGWLKFLGYGVACVRGACVRGACVVRANVCTDCTNDYEVNGGNSSE